MIRRPPRSTLDRSSAASDVYKRQVLGHERKRQLLGLAETEPPSLVQPLMKQAGDAYKKYFNEQVELKNHDFVLNMPFHLGCLLYTSPSPRDRTRSRMPSYA